MEPITEIIIVIDGARYASRLWYCVPRVGEFILLKGKEVYRQAEVKKVVWGVLGFERVGENRVTLECEWVKD